MDPLIVIVGGLIFISVFYVIPITLGIREARNKNRSTSWMWFAIYPIGGWITFLILRASPKLKTCSECGEKAKVVARICPYCLNSFERRAAANPIPAAGERKRKRGGGKGKRRRGH